MLGHNEANFERPNFAGSIRQLGDGENSLHQLE